MILDPMKVTLSDSEITDAIIDLEMLYVPYGRMDRPIKGYVFSLKYFAALINSLNFHSVLTLDNHSAETANRIQNLGELDLNPFINEVIHRFQPDILFFPDKGAMKKYPKKLDVIKHEQIPYFYGEKQRILDDSREIISYELYTNGIEIKDKRVLIIDDICCTGGTVLKTYNFNFFDMIISDNTIACINLFNRRTISNNIISKKLKL